MTNTIRRKSDYQQQSAKEHMRKKQNVIKAGGALIISLAMLITPVNAFATSIEEEAERSSSFELGDGKKGALFLAFHQSEDIITPTVSDTLRTDFPEVFDLRDYGVVTPVKQQNPFGTCWGFSAIAASETSILSSSGQTYEETGLDLSEHHLTYFTRTAIDDPEDPQFKEGSYMLFPDTNPLNSGGMFVTATSVLSSGIGPVYEEIIPYRGKNSNPQSAFLFLNLCYSEDDDWTLPSEYKFVQNYQLLESNILDDPAVYASALDPDEEDPAIRAEYYLGNDMHAIDEIKEELMNGHAVSVAFAADQSMPGQVVEDEGKQCLTSTADGKWLHYTPDCRPATHAVTIVGWDDTIKSTDFKDHSTFSEGDGKPHQPQGDGAFIVKNSWGAANRDFPDIGTFGNTVSGKNDGYFYLSYYDPTIICPESFEYIPTENEEPYNIDQYDYMPSEKTYGWLADTGLMMSNIFTAEKDEYVDSLSCQTFENNTKVNYKVYKLTSESLSPTDGSLEASVDATYEKRGYHRILLPDSVYVEEGCNYSVVVTETLENDGQLYYGLCTSKNINQNGVEQAKEDTINKHPDDYENHIKNLSYYKGIVNPGESFVYIDELLGWYDFSDMIETIQKNSDDKYEHDYDNFPIKAYCSFANEEDILALENEPLPPLEFSAPASIINTSGLAKLGLIALGALILFIAIIIVTVKLIKRAVRKKKAKKAADVKDSETASFEDEKTGDIAEGKDSETADEAGKATDTETEN